MTGRDVARSILVVGAQYPPHSLGGYELLCSEHVAHLRGAGRRVTVLTSTFGVHARCVETGPAGEQIARALDFRWRDYVILRPRGPRLWRSERRQREAVDRAVAQSRCDVAVVWHMAAISKAVLARLHRHGVPLVLVIGEPWPMWDVADDPWTARWSRDAVRPLPRRLKPAVTRLLTRVITDADVRPALRACVPVYASDHLRAMVESRLPEWSGRGHVVRNGIDVDAFTRDRPPDQPLGRPLRLLVVGRVERRKGAHTAVEALAAIREAGVDVRLDVVGWPDQAYADELRALANRLGVSDRFELRGPRARSELPDLYLAADILLFPTVWAEPFGLVPLEAMAAGCLVVATGTGGSAEVLDDGANALLFGVEDAAAAARCVLRLAADPGLVAHLRRGGRSTVAHHRFEEYADGVDAVVDEVFRSRRMRG